VYNLVKRHPLGSS